MDELELQQYLGSFRNYIGSFSRDRIEWPIILPIYTGIIINTDLFVDNGSHWTAIYNGDYCNMYFDSFGQPPELDEMKNYLNSLGKPWIYNPICFQSLYQDTCGNYSMFFLICMFKYNDFNKFVEIFNHNTHVNDIIAKLLYKLTVNK